MGKKELQELAEEAILEDLKKKLAYLKVKRMLLKSDIFSLKH